MFENVDFTCGYKPIDLKNLISLIKKGLMKVSEINQQVSIQ